MRHETYVRKMNRLIRRFKDGKITVKQLREEGRKLFEARYGLKVE